MSIYTGYTDVISIHAHHIYVYICIYVFVYIDIFIYTVDRFVVA